MLEHTYVYNKVVIGGSLSALIYANKTSSCFIDNAVDSIFPFDTIIHPVDLGSIRFAKGAPKLKVHDHLSYLLNVRGLSPFGKSVESIRLNLEKREMSISSNFFRSKKLRFSDLHVFDTTNVHGLPFEDFEIEKYRVFDWFAVRSGMRHEFDHIEGDSDFAKKIYFYLSPRIDGNKDKKDMVVESVMSEDQIRDVDHSDSIVRLKALNMMKDAGIKGTSNGVGKNLSLRIELQKREVLPVKLTNYGEEGVLL